MTGLLIYDSVGAERNQWFINEFQKTAERKGIVLTFIIADNVQELSFCDLPDFAVVRTINPQINRFFESRKVPCFNNTLTSEVANDKWRTYCLARELKLPVMETHLASELCGYESLKFPLVVKSLNGHGGTEVFLVHDKSEYEELFLKIGKDNFIVQEFCSTPGTDMRVYTLGGNVIKGIVRRSDSDFRSNFSLGGKVGEGPVSEEQISIIQKLYNTLGFDLVGVDFILHNGQWVLNEIEDVVGTRMLYKCTDIDIVDLYFEHILSSCAYKKSLL